MAITAIEREALRPMHGELVQAAQRGDRAAFGTLIQGRIPRLYASARLILRDRELAEDAVQDALIDAWRDVRGLRDPERFDAWLHRLLVRGCHRAATRDRRRRVAEISLAFDHDAPSPEGLDHILDRDHLERAFARLTVDQRTILVLTHYADLSLADVSSVLGIPLGTTKSRLSRATDAFRVAVAADERAAALTIGRTA